MLGDQTGRCDCFINEDDDATHGIAIPCFWGRKKYPASGTNPGIWKHINGDMDNIKARKDLEELGVKNACWVQDEQEIPDAPWILTKEEKEVVKKIIGAICTPTRTMHSLKGAFTSDDKELTDLKSHDWHKMLQLILPIAMTSIDLERVRACIIKLSSLV
ncbi:hypothetical protein L7F22_037086, partial [Adiantum nelumboides]|nr:hypothetical protein [Adiantum nelumboides]